MKLIDGRIRLNDLAAALGVTGQSLRNHLKNESGLGDKATKFGSGLTGDYLLSIDSVLNYLDWAYSHSKKLNYDTIKNVETEITCLRKV